MDDDLNKEFEILEDFEEAMNMSWQLTLFLEKLRPHGRVFSIAHTEAEKLHAWIIYAVGSVPKERDV